MSESPRERARRFLAELPAFTGTQEEALAAADEHARNVAEEEWGPGFGSKVRRMAKPVMVMRSLRVPLNLWNEARAKADERDENISDVIREALERYVRSKR